MKRIPSFQFRTVVLLLSVLLSSCRFLGIGSIPIDVLKSKYANSESEFVQIRKRKPSLQRRRTGAGGHSFTRSLCVLAYLGRLDRVSQRKV